LARGRIGRNWADGVQHGCLNGDETLGHYWFLKPSLRYNEGTQV
jgi:hypothetical protein